MSNTITIIIVDAILFGVVAMLITKIWSSKNV